MKYWCNYNLLRYLSIFISYITDVSKNVVKCVAQYVSKIFLRFTYATYSFLST